MSKAHGKAKGRTTPRSKSTAIQKASSAAPNTKAFDEVIDLIRRARRRALHAVNAELIELYWRIGEAISRRIAKDGWGQGTVAELAAHIQRRDPGVRGFSPQNLWRMRQFFEAYRDQPKLSTLLRELPWSSNLHILTKTKRPDEREFYLRLATRNRWPVREVARQIDGALFERAALARPKLSTALRESHPRAEQEFKDAYLIEFLDLPDPHSESDLHRGLVRNLGRFLTELGRDFCFVGSEYPVQVGGKDFALDLCSSIGPSTASSQSSSRSTSSNPSTSENWSSTWRRSTATSARRTRGRRSASCSALRRTARSSSTR